MSPTLCLLGSFLCILLLNCDKVKSSPETDAWKVFDWMGKDYAVGEMRKLATGGLGKYTLEANVRVKNEPTTKIPVTLHFELTARGTYVNSCDFAEGENGKIAIGTGGDGGYMIIRPAGSRQAYKVSCTMFEGATITKLLSFAEMQPLPGMGTVNAAKELCAVANGQTTITWLVERGRFKVPINFFLDCTPGSAVVLACSFGTSEAEQVMVTVGDRARIFFFKPKGDWFSKKFSLSCGAQTGATLAWLD